MQRFVEELLSNNISLVSRVVTVSSPQNDTFGAS